MSSNPAGSPASPTAGSDSGPTSADLGREYGLDVSVLASHPGGFESECWVADDAWFIKVWRDQISSRAAPDGALSRLEILRGLQELGLPVPAPVPTLSGRLYATWNARPYAVFPYVHGRPAIDADWRQSARALRQVHDAIPALTLPGGTGSTADTGSTGGLGGTESAGGVREDHEASLVRRLPMGTLDESDVQLLAGRLDHPWIADRSDQLAEAIGRLDDAVRRAEGTPVRRVLCHTDFTSLNLIVGSDQQIAAILDWDQAVFAPREHDLWIAAETRQVEDYLTEYGADDLSIVHLEYALLSRALRDLTARVLGEVDRSGVQTWGFDRLARLDDDLARFRPFCTGV